MVGHASLLAYPIRFNLKNNKWEQIGSNRKVLFIATEMEKDEIQTLVLAYLADVNEEKILFGNCTPAEKERVLIARKIMKKYEENFQFERVGDPNIDDLTNIVRKHKVKNQIEYLFYDYIFSSPSLLSQYRDLKLREDVVLMMLSTAIKDLCTNLDIFAMSGTQLNGDYQEWKGLRNQNLIRGSKAIIDKVDAGMITLPVTTDEARFLDKLIKTMGVNAPTHVTDVYKVRRGRINNVRIWSKIDLGTCRKEDLFVTDVDYNPIQINIMKYMAEGFGGEVNDFIKEINNEISQETTEEEEEIKEIKENIIKIEEKDVPWYTDEELVKKEKEKEKEKEIDWKSFI